MASKAEPLVHPSGARDTYPLMRSASMHVPVRQ
jgi:hypothetical protein